MNIAYNMDCLAAMKEMPDNAFDLAVVDPPYGDGCSQSVQVERERERAEGGSTTDSAVYSTSTNNPNRFGQRFDRYKHQTITRGGGMERTNTISERRTNGRKVGSEVREKNYRVGCCPGKRILRSAFSHLTQSNHLGRQLLCLTADTVLSDVAKD